MTLRAALLSDGRPGHFNLAEGILAAIARHHPLDISRIDIRRPPLAPGRLLSLLTNARISPRFMLETVYRTPVSRLASPDLIVSAGGNTLAANIAANRITGAPNIFYGSLRRFRPQDFTLVFTSYLDDAAGPGRLMRLKPSRHDPDCMEGAVPALQPGALPAFAGLVVGGNSGTVTFDDDDWSRLLELPAACNAAWGTRWLISNSPRTPPQVSDRMAALLRDQPDAIVEFIDVRTAGPGTLGRLLATSEMIVCTADSSSMISESVWTRRPVLAVSPSRFALPDKEAAYRAWMASQGWQHQMPIAAATPSTMLVELATLTPLTINPLDIYYEDIRTAAPQLFP